MKQRQEGIKKRLVLFIIEDHNVDEDPWPWSGEPIYRNGKYCGLTTSTAFSFGCERHICLGYVQDFDDKTREPKLINNDFIIKNAKFEINIGGKLFPAKGHLYAPMLPTSVQNVVHNVAK